MENTVGGIRSVAADEGKALWVLGDLYRFMAVGEDTNGTYALLETTATPGLPGPPPHIHHMEDEAFSSWRASWSSPSGVMSGR